MSEFWEYRVVLNKTADLDRLTRLDLEQLSQARATRLLDYLKTTFDLPDFQVSYTGWTDSGWYDEDEHRIQVRKDNISAEVLVHELAHHWVYTKMEGEPSSPHGHDFVVRLDQLADVAEFALMTEEI